MGNKLDRITIRKLDSEKDLEKKGRVCFKLHVNRNVGPYIGNEYLDSYYIIAKLSSGEKVFDQSIMYKKLIDKQKFLNEVNDDLTQMNCYLAETQYSKRFFTFGLHKVKGILYKKITD